VLALQRQIGNRAVGALLARAPTLKDPPKPKVEMTSGPSAVIPKVGTIHLQSVQIGGQLPSSGGTRGGGAPRTDVTVSCAQGDHSSALFRAILENKDIGPVEIVFVKDGKPYMTVKLIGVTVTSYSISGSAGDAHSRPMETFTMTPEKIEYTATATSE
jgi:type VI protein secretion system component Hcp